MIHLSDTQAILLSTASQREDGSILPLPSILTPGGGASKAVDALIKRCLAEERETNDADAVRRAEGDRRYGVFITAAGLVAIGVEEGNIDSGEPPAATLPPTPAAKINKTAAVIDLLRRPSGATLSELIEATGWLPHTTRAALTGIRKKGHNLRAQVNSTTITATGAIPACWKAQAHAMLPVVPVS